MSRLLVTIAIAMWIAPLAPRAGGDDVDVAMSFRSFCAEWMTKLESRERRNQRRAGARRNGDGVVLEYTGYVERPLRCEAKRSGSSAVGAIGQIAYHQLTLQQHGRTRDRALRSRPAVLRRIEVIEIFRFDGSRWVY